MDWRVLVAIGLSISFAAGCVSDDGAPLLRPDAVELQGLDLIVEDRPIAATVMWHEEPVQSEPEQALGDIQMTNQRWARDVPMTYHGIQPVYDEWGRETRAFLFRYVAMTIDVDCQFVDFTIACTGEWVERPVEVAFDEADGRYLGGVSLEYGIRSFVGPQYRDPVVSTGSNVFFLMVHKVLGGDLDRPIDLGDGYSLHFDRSDERPLPGLCDEYVLRVEGPESAGISPETPDTEEESRSLVCFDGSGFPLWTWSGTSDDHIEVTRLDPAMALPAFAGEPMPAVEHERRPWDPVPMLDPVLPAVRMPPIGNPGDYADVLRPLLGGLLVNPDYIQYQLTHDAMWLDHVVKAFPYFDPLALVLGTPPLFEESSWLWTTDGEGDLWNFIDSRYGSLEEPDLHRSERSSDFDFSEIKYTSPDELPLVPPGIVQAAWESVAPVDAGMLSFMLWPSFDETSFFTDHPEYQATWNAISHCFELPERGVQPMYASFSAVSGQMMSAGHATSTLHGCSSGTMSASSSVGGGEFLVKTGAGTLRFLVGAAGEPSFVVDEAGHVRVLATA